MKREPELILKILSTLESRTESGLTTLEIEGYSPQDVSYHIKLLVEDGCVEGVDASSLTNPMDWMVGDLLIKGHEHLETLKDKKEPSKLKPKTRAEHGRSVAASKMDDSPLLSKFRALLESKSDVEDNGPHSGPGQKWLAKGWALFHQLDEQRAANFNELASAAQVPLSSHAARPLWSKMILMVEQAIEELKASVSETAQNTYNAGDAYDFYRDCKNIIADAKKSVFIIDLYMDEEIFSLYLDKASLGIHIRLLIGKPSDTFKRVADKFRLKVGVQLEIRSSKDFHDRVIFIDDETCWVTGQSLNVAATKKPTYMFRAKDIEDIKSQHEGIWAKATVV